MIDLDEGRLKAWLDDELTGAEAEDMADQVARDGDLRRRVDEIRLRDSRTLDLLERLEPPPAPTARVLAVVRQAREDTAEGARPIRRQAGHAGGWARRTRLAQAAGMVLLLAGAASAAIPGSPVREWIERALGPEAPAAAGPVELPSASTPDAPDSTGASIAPASGRIGVELVGLPAGAEILVTSTDGGRAWVYAPAGSSLEVDDGRGTIVARATAGPVRVVLPSDVATVDLRVNGRVYLTKRDGRWHLEVPAADSTDTLIRLRAGS